MRPHGDHASALQRNITRMRNRKTQGTEYTLTGVTGRSISVKATLNKGTSTLGPVLKRVGCEGGAVVCGAEDAYSQARAASSQTSDPGLWWNRLFSALGWRRASQNRHESARRPSTLEIRQTQSLSAYSHASPAIRRSGAAEPRRAGRGRTSGSRRRRARADACRPGPGRRSSGRRRSDRRGDRRPPPAAA